MARIVCQALQRSGRITFVWSEGDATFEPYHLEGAEREEFERVAEQGRSRLALAVTEAAPAEPEIAQLGHQLYRALFRLDAPERGAAAEVQSWLEGQVAAIESLEFLTDGPGGIPWNLLCERPAWDAVWGRRFNLVGGRRVNALRSTPLIESPTRLLAIDGDLAESLGTAGREAVQRWQDAGELVVSADGLASRLGDRAPDLLIVVAGVEKDGLRFGSDRLRLDTLRDWLDEAPEGTSTPIVVLIGVGAPERGWAQTLETASRLFDGLVAAEVPLPAEAGLMLALRFAEQFLTSHQPLGACLYGLHQAGDVPSLALSAFCPPTVRVVAEGAADEDIETEFWPLPETPYRPFAPYEYDDRPLFSGREQETAQLARLVDDPVTPGLFVHGGPSVGKTSLVQAGLLPYLEHDSVGFLALRDRSATGVEAEADYPLLVLRATGDLAGQLADALTVFCSQPYCYTTPTGKTVSVDLPGILAAAASVTSAVVPPADTAVAVAAEATHVPAPAPTAPVRELWIALNDDPYLLGHLLDELTRDLPFELVMAIDQGEELLTEVGSMHEQQRRRVALEMLGRLGDVPARCKMILCLRGEFLGRLVGLFPAVSGSRGWREFYVAALSQDQAQEALLLPTSRIEIPRADEVPYRKYHLAFDAGLARQIVTQAWREADKHQYSPLLRAQAIGSLLYDRAALEPGGKPFGNGDLKTNGGVANAPKRLLELRLNGLTAPLAAKQALIALITRLCSRGGDGVMTRDLVAAKNLGVNWRRSERVEPIVNEAAREAGLFQVQRLFIGGQDGTYVSVAADGIAKTAQLVQDEDRQRAFGRSRIVDTLWIMIPLLFLVGSATFFLTRVYGVGEAAADNTMPRDKVLELLKQVSERNDQVQMPLYRGQLTQADQALRAGNALRARQFLLSIPARFAEKTNPKAPGIRPDFEDLRGFDWRYLWRQLNSERHQLEGHIGRINAVAVTPDGKRAASASADGTVRVWDLVKGQIIVTLSGTKGAVHAVAFSPSGATLASAGADRVVRLWELDAIKDTGGTLDKASHALSGHEGAVLALAFAKEGDVLASAGADKTIILWDAKEKKERTRLKDEHKAAIHALAFGPDGKTLASGGAEPDLVVWDVAEAKKQKAIATGLDTVATLAFEPNGTTLAGGGSLRKLGTDQGLVRFWDPATGKEARPAFAHSTGVFALAFRPDGKALATAGKDTHVRLWDLDGGRELGSWSGHLGWVRSIAFADNGATLLTGGYDTRLRVWDAHPSHGPQVLPGHGDSILTLALNENDTILASGGRDGAVLLWDVATGRPAGKLPPQAGAVTGLVFAPWKEKIVLAVGTRNERDEGTLNLWEVMPAKEGHDVRALAEFEKVGKGITSLAAADERLLAGHTDGTATIWNTKTGKVQATCKDGHVGETRAVAFAFDNRSVVTGGDDRSVTIWDAATGKPDPQYPRMANIHTAPIMALTTVMAGKEQQLLFTAGQDQVLRIWSLEPHEAGEDDDKGGAPAPVRTYRAHNQPIGAIVCRGKLLATGSWDHSIQLYDMQRGERLNLTGHTGPIRALAATGDQNVLISAGDDKTIRIWRAAPEEAAPKRVQQVQPEPDE